MIAAQIKSSIVLIAILLTVSIAAKAIGSLQPINPTLRGFTEGCENKPQPCWYGIVVGVTTRKDAQTIGGKLGSITCRLQLEYSDLDETITAIGLEACDYIRSGDLFNQYLALSPDKVRISFVGGETLLSRIWAFRIELPHPPPVFIN